MDINRIKSKKGSAAVLTLSVIMVLMALGTIALLASVSNIRMGDKFRTWSKAFYQLDYSAEGFTKQIDDALKSAEASARQYMSQECYLKTNPLDASLLDSDPDSGTGRILNVNAQQFFKDNWWGMTLIDYLAANPTKTESDYINEVQTHTTDFFNKLYFYYAANRLQALDAAVPEITIAPTSNLSKFTNIPTLDPLDPSNWANCVPMSGDIKLRITVADGTAGDPKRVETDVNVSVPDYTTVIQTSYMPYKMNPVYANAITAYGGINFNDGNNDVQIYGDVYSSALTAGSQGIRIGTNATAQIFGNVYSKGDIQIAGDLGQFYVYDYNTASLPGNFTYLYTGKYGIYSNEALYDKSIVPVSILDKYLQDSTFLGSNLTALLYKDRSKYGNVYCNNLIVNEGVTGAISQIEGNIMTKDDIEMDGVNSSITVDGNFVGISSEADDTTFDPNASSSVINNQPIAEASSLPSKIFLKGHVIVPGTAFTDFNDGSLGPPDVSNFEQYYYQTAESASAKSWEIQDAYSYTGDIPGVNGKKYKMDNTSYYLNDTNLKNKIKYFVEYITGTGAFTGSSHNVVTNIMGGNDIDGYSLGLSLFHKQTGIDTYDANASMFSIDNTLTGTINLPNGGANQFDFKDAQPSLIRIFDSKTKDLGTNGSKTFSQLVADNTFDTTKLAGSGVFYYGSDASIPVGTAGIDRGIIYCKGNLTLTGTGTFSGAIVCEGNVTINGNVRIIYDEDELKRVFAASKAARDFFSNGAMGNDFAFYKDYTTTSGIKTLVKRYKIDKWQEISG